MQKVLLIHPPVSKPCEPPAGIARLAGALRERGIPCTVLDANVEGLHFLLNAQLAGQKNEIRGHGPVSKASGIVSTAGADSGAVSPDMTGLVMAVRDRAGNTWSKRAVRNLPRHLQSLRSWPLYGHSDRYRRAVADINRVLAGASPQECVTVSLADYEDASLSPLRSQDLLQAAAQPESNPFYPYFRARLLPLLKEQDHEIVGISLNYLSQALCAFALIGFIRAILPRRRIILGGGLVTSWLRQPEWQRAIGGNMAPGTNDSGADALRKSGANSPFGGLVDDLVAGPGEEFLVSLASKDDVQDIYHRDSKDLSAQDSVLSPGALYNSLLPSSLPTNPARQEQGVVSETTVPCPDYRSFPWELYMSPGVIIPYSASTGCYWRRCRFCPETAEGNPYRPLPVGKVLADLARLQDESKPALIHFLDNAVSPVLLAALAEQRNRVPWYGFVRIAEAMADPAFCRRLRDAGCVMLKLGLESGDQGVLDTLEKGISLQTASLVIRNLKEAGIGTYVYLLFGTPAEDRAAAFRTREYVVANSPWIDFLNVAIFNMPVFAAAGLATRPFSAGDLSLYTDFEHPRGWNRREVRRFIAEEVRKHPAIAAILNRVPRIFTSNHAPLNLIGVRLR